MATRDPLTDQVVVLFHHRADRWDLHFRFEGAEIIPLTGVGRGTVFLLRMNDEQRMLLRAELLRQGRYRVPSPPEQSGGSREHASSGMLRGVG